MSPELARALLGLANIALVISLSCTLYVLSVLVYRYAYQKGRIEAFGEAERRGLGDFWKIREQPFEWEFRWKCDEKTDGNG